MSKSFCVLAMILAIAAGTVYAADPSEFIVWNYGSMVGRLYVPTNYDSQQSYPLIVFFHGAGEYGTDNVQQVNSNIDTLFNECKQREIFLYAPQASSPFFTAGEITYAMQKVNDTIAAYSIDSDRVYVTGLSAGGGATFLALENHGNMLAAGVGICSACGGERANDHLLVGKPFWLFEGHDDFLGANLQAVNGIRSEDGGKPPLVFPLDANAGNPYYNTGAPYYNDGTTFYEENYLRYTEYDDETHSIWHKAYGEEHMYDWLLNQTLTNSTDNDQPVVDAGVDHYITWPTNQISLSGSVTDDGDPNPPGAVTLTWAKQFGPGTVTLSAPNSLNTAATFSAVGTYELVLVADDGGRQGHDEVLVTVYDQGQGPERVVDNAEPGYAEHGGSWTYSTSSGYKGDIAYDADETDSYATFEFGGLVPGEYYVRTTYVASSNRNAAVPYTIYDGTTAGTSLGTVYVNQKTFPSGYSYDGKQWDEFAGTYTITGNLLTVKLEVVYGQGFSIADAVLIEPAGTSGNTTPSVDAGSDDAITLPTDTVSLDGTVSDDGLPNPPASVTTTWTRQSGPGTVTFGNANAVDTTATFSTDGVYVLRLTANDSQLSDYDDVTITVNPIGQDVPLNVLFIGNSFTVQDVPRTFERIAMDAGWQPPNVTSTAVVSQTLEWHTTNQDTLDAIDQGGWDYVVLQEYSTRPTDSTTATNADPAQFKADATWLYDRVKTYSPNAQIILYETWARHENHSDYPTHYADRDEMQGQLDYHYHDAADTYIPNNSTAQDTDDVTVAPVGEAWHLNYHNVNLMLHDTDLYHAGYPGRYLAGMVIYSTIYGRSVADRTPQWDIGYDDAVYLQAVADTTTGTTTLGGPDGPKGFGVFHPSFEEPAMENDGTFTNKQVVGWTVNVGSTNALGVRNSSDSQFSNTSKVGGVDQTLPSPADGYQFLWVNSGDISQQLIDLQEINTQYMLTVAVGRILDAGYTDTTYYIKLYAGDTLLGTLTGDTANITAGAFEDKSLVVQTNGSADTTVPLRIHLGREGAYTTTKLAFDNVRLTSTPIAANAAPSVDAGSDDAITLPTDTVNLDGMVSDDELPNPPASVTTTWTKQSGPGTVTFGNANAVDTTATFSTDGVYVLRLTADDSDLDAYDEVTITVSPAAQPTLVVIDNGDTGYAEHNGTWWHGTGGYLDDQAGDVDETNSYATFQFDGLSPGSYYVRTTYVNSGNRNDAVPYTIYDGTEAGTSLGTVYVDQKYSAPSGYTYDSADWDEIGTFTITGNTLTVVIDVVYGQGFSMADAVLIESVGGATNTAPSVDAGSDDAITLPTDTVNLDGTVSDDGLPNPPASVTTTWTKQSGPGTVTFGNANAMDTTATFSTDGVYVLCLTADDSDLDAYDEVTITVSPAAQPALVVIDNGDAGYTEHNGTWWHGTGGYLDDQAVDVDETNSYATFQFDGLTPGAYDVRTTYVNSGNRNQYVPYTVYDGTEAGTSLGTVYVDQKYSAPSGYSYNGANWDELGTFTITGTTLTVKIDVVYGQGFSMADAVMIERVNTAPSVNAGSDDTITLPTDTVNLDGTVSDDGLPDPPAGVTTTWTKQSGPGTVTFGNANAVDTTATFSTDGVYVLRLTADDGDLTEYDEVTITVDPAPQPTLFLIDNGDSGYVEHNGSWWHSSSEGYLGDTAGDADEANTYATFQFDGLTPGSYDVRTTYTNSGNRNQYVPYTIYDGTEAGTSLGTIYVDQKYSAPSGYSYDGWGWDELGTFTITGTTLTVKIEVVYGQGFSMADAVMIEGPQ